MGEAIECHGCAEALARWAGGGHHLSCRACEASAAAQRIEQRAAFYAGLAARARMAPTASPEWRGIAPKEAVSGGW